MTAFIILCVVLYAAALGVVWFVSRAEREVERMVDEALATEAADWGEPTRAQVETGWLDEVNEFWWIFPAPEFKDTPIFAELHRDRFVADALEEIDALTGGDAA